MQIVEDIPAAVEQLRSARRHKALWFCNRRRDVEAVAAALSDVWPQDRVVAHHGSLSRAEREAAEQAMQEWTWGICVATMTLEVGIDIGTTDAVVLHGPPLSLSAFRQRIGRACRQHSSVFALGVSLRDGDSETFQAMAEAARTGEVEHQSTEPDLSVAIQQTFSLLFGAPSGLERELLVHLLQPLALRPTLLRLWAHLSEEGWIEAGRSDRLRATTKLMDAGERGRIHGNIPEPSELRFRDADTGKMLGSGLAGVSVGDVLVFGGRTRRVVSVDAGHVRMERASGQAGLPRFTRRSSGGAWRWLLPADLREGEPTST
jgi:ATP-dependent Lhr-like helicase